MIWAYFGYPQKGTPHSEETWGDPGKPAIPSSDGTSLSGSAVDLGDFRIFSLQEGRPELIENYMLVYNSL